MDSISIRGIITPEWIPYQFCFLVPPEVRAGRKKRSLRFRLLSARLRPAIQPLVGPKQKKNDWSEKLNSRKPPREGRDKEEEEKRKEKKEEDKESRGQPKKRKNEERKKEKTISKQKEKRRKKQKERRQKKDKKEERRKEKEEND